MKQSASKNILVTLTSRGNYATAGSLLHELEEDPEIELDIVIAGAAMIDKYGKLSDIIQDAGLEVSEELFNLLEGGNTVSSAKTTGLGMIEFTNAITRLEPDAVITIGDRYETMSLTLSASYMNIPVIHLLGGELTGSIDDKVRHATTKIADYHFVATDKSKEVVKGLGENRERVFKTGCPSMDFVVDTLQEDSGPYDPQEDYDGEGATLDVSEDYIVVQYHPVTTKYGQQYENTITLLKSVQGLDMQTFWFWPNMDAGTNEVSRAIQDFRKEENTNKIKFFTNLEPKDYIRLVNNSACYLGNSSVGIRECSFMGHPSVNIGDRQEDREKAENTVTVQCEKEEIKSAVKKQLNKDYEESHLYGDGNAGEKMKEIIKKKELSIKPSMELANLNLQ